MSGASLEIGFRTLDREVKNYSLPIEGEIPDWLTGTFLRNGPGKFEADGKRVDHWFDGLAMVRKYEFSQDELCYSNRFLRTESYQRAENGNLRGQFSTGQTGLEKLRNWLTQLGPPEPLDNANVNVAKIDGQFVAMTEVPRWISFDDETLATSEEFEFTDQLSPDMITAHPVPDPQTGAHIGHAQSFGRTHEYQIFRIPPGERRRELIRSIPTDSPSYVHSIGVSQDHIVLIETPLKIKIMKSLSPFTGGFCDMLEWQADTQTQLYVVDRTSGEIVTAPTVDPFFTFHIVNAFDDDGAVVFDLITFEDGSIVESLDLQQYAQAGADVSPAGHLKRYRVEPDGTTTTRHLHERKVVLPEVFPSQKTSRHTTVFAQDHNPDGTTGVLKVDTERGVATDWHEDGLYIEEPCPVQHPDAQQEDEGVVLAPALDMNAEQSVLLVLDAKTLTELARAKVPHHNPFGFHGQFFHSK